MEKKITVAGNILADLVKTVEVYPEKGMLSTITDIKRGVGGCVPNTAICLKKIDPEMHIRAVGRVGRDEYGSFALGELERAGIDTAFVRRTDTPTSFSDVISVRSTGERTFFHFRGANAEFCDEDVAPASLDCALFHIGYVMLLDALDARDDEYGTRLARLLSRVRAHGIATSIDCVSETSGVFREKVIPALKYCTYAILNEIEAASVSGIPARGEDGALDDAGIVQTMRFFLQCGVSGKVIVHAPEAGYLMDKSGYALKVPSLELPEGFIKGKVGAGDAFCAGALHGLITGMNDEEVLRFASAAAASSLSAKDATSGMGNRVEILALDSWFKRQKGTRLC